MTEEIKEILDDIRFVAEEPSILEKGTYEDGEEYSEEFDNYLFLEHKQDKILYDYITNLQQNYNKLQDDYQEQYTYEYILRKQLQQDLDKANDIIEKDRQFNEGRLLDLAKLKEENEKLKYWLNDVIFDENNTNVELPARYLKKLGYIDFDDENKVYINKHNNGPFMQEDNKEKAFYLKDEELNEYTQQLEIQNEDYKSRCEKAIEYINFVINHYKEQLETPIEDTYFDSDVNRKGYILSIIAYLQTTLDTLIGSDEK